MKSLIDQTGPGQILALSVPFIALTIKKGLGKFDE